MRHLLKTTAAALIASAAFQALANHSQPLNVGRIANISITDRSTGQALPVYWHGGEYWIAGQPGAKYAIQIRNSRGQRILAVTSVDGLNVLSGETADYSQSGYVFESGQRYGIDGWRKSDSQVAAFVFTASGDSYAERVGKPRDVGVIGVALFREQPPVAIYSPPVVAQRNLPAPSAPISADTAERLRENYESSAASAKSAPAPAPAPSSAMPESSAPAETSARRAAPTYSPTPSHIPSPIPSPKLGTAHGERETSIVTRTQFIRNSAQPDEIIRIRYDSHANLIAMGVLPNPRIQPAPNAFPGAVTSYVPDPPAWR